jgi:hypothetical protein
VGQYSKEGTTISRLAHGPDPLPGAGAGVGERKGEGMKHYIAMFLWMLGNVWLWYWLVRDYDLLMVWWGLPYIVSVVMIIVFGIICIADLAISDKGGRP